MMIRFVNPPEMGDFLLWERVKTWNYLEKVKNIEKFYGLCNNMEIHALKNLR